MIALTFPKREALLDILLSSLGRVPLTVSAHWFPFVIALGIMMSMAGLLARGMGLHNIFHEDPELCAHARRHGPRVLLGSPTFLAQIWLTVFLALVWGFAYTLGIVAEGSVAMERLDARFDDLGPGGLTADGVNAGLSHGFGSTIGPQVLLSAILSLGFATVRMEGMPPLQKGEAWRAVAGVVVGIFVAWGLAKIAVEIAPSLNRFLDGFGLSGGNTFALAIPSAILMTVVLSLRRMNSAIALISLFALILIFYACVSAIPDVLQPWVLLAFGGLIVATNALFMGRGRASARLKFEIPNILDAEGNSYYEPDRQKDLETFYRSRQRELGGSGISDAEDAGGQIDSSARAPKAEGALDPIATLERWRASSGVAKPRLVLLACSGGAYRAGFWTALVLDRLTEMERKRELPGFSRSMRLITGASGGMVGASYFAAMADPMGGPTPPVVPQMERDILAVQSIGGIPGEDGAPYDPAPHYPYKRAFPIPRDSLSPIAQQLVQRDLPGLFSRATQRVDRGTVLEDQWASLDVSFEAMRTGEAEGWRPSLLFSPMLAETGQPLLISNLDVRKVRSDPDGVEMADFFEWFPGARQHFRVKTAVRLNASFPYIAPSAALPTAPYRRVVDAGYYDNYGVDLAVSYLSQRRIREWIVENCSGVMLVQTRAFPFVEPSVDPPGSVARAFQWLTTPLDAAGAARGATMTFRNSQSLRQIQRIYAFFGGRPGFLSVARFEVKSFTSLSWYMTERELDDLRGDCPDHRPGHAKAEDGGGLESEGNRQAFDAVRAFWTATGGA